jgi:hypothetical protein
LRLFLSSVGYLGRRQGLWRADRPVDARLCGGAWRPIVTAGGPAEPIGQSRRRPHFDD